MIRLGLAAALLLFLLSAAIGGIRYFLPRSIPPSAHMHLIIDSGDCPMPCWLGIRPGVTTMTQAFDLLRVNPYIDLSSIQPLNGSDQAVSLTAEWRTPADPLQPDPAVPHNVIIENQPGYNIVKIIIVHVDVSLGEFVLRYGPPARSAMARLPVGTLFYVLEYPTLGLQYSAFMPCRKGLSIANVMGNSLLLQPLDQYQSNVGDTMNMGWSGFSARPFDQRATHPGCY